MAVRSYKDMATFDIAHQENTKRARKRLPYELHEIAHRKIIFLEHADGMQDLVEWKSLRLEKLKGDRAGQFSIRINEKYRICFYWNGKDALDVEITDYH